MFLKKKEKPFKRGDIISVTDNDQVYFNYSQFIKYHMQYAIRWVYKEFPDVEPPRRNRYRVLGCYKHVREDRYDKNKSCIVIQALNSKQIYLIGERGIAPYEEAK